MIKYCTLSGSKQLYRINGDQLEVFARMSRNGKRSWGLSLYNGAVNKLKKGNKIHMISDEEAALWMLEND